MRGLLVILPCALLASACGSGSSKPTSANTGTPNPAATTRASSVTGFGATDAAWNSAHTAVSGFAPGSVYDADPSLPKVNGHEGTHYVGVIHENGRVVSYDYMFTNRPIAMARSDVLRTQFPHDAKVAWFAVKSTCAQMMVTSATLAKALSSKAIGDKDGSAFVEFSSGAAENSYNPKAVNDATFLLLPLEPKNQAPGC
jgi:hypothetical protein